MEKQDWETAPNDGQNNQKRYSKLLATIDEYATIPTQGKRKYYFQNPINLNHIKRFLKKRDAQGVAYVTRIKDFYHATLFCAHTPADWANITRDEVDQAVGKVRTILNDKGQKRFIEDLKHISKFICPELDEKGRPDDKLVPYSFRHLVAKTDKSRQKTRKLPDPDDIINIIQYFRQDPRIQALTALMYESLARPTEALFLKIEDIEPADNYSNIEVRGQGKEGTKLLECIDSHPYVLRWYNEHPLRDKKESWFFCNLGDRGRHKRMTTVNFNKHLANACKALGIKKVTGYDLKRAGVTHARLRGDDDVALQHRAGWTSTRQLQTYDHSRQRESIRLQLIKRGLISRDEVEPKFRKLLPENRQCAFCNAHNGIAESICKTCKRPLDRRKAMETEKQDQLKLLEEFIQLPHIREKLMAYVREGKEKEGK